MTDVKVIVCLANSRKHNARRIAGIEILDRRPGGWVRPISSRPGAEVPDDERRYSDGSDPNVLDTIEVSLLEPAPVGYQVENWILDPDRDWIRTGKITWAHLGRLEDDRRPLWLSDGPSTRHGMNDRVLASDADSFTDSLRLIRVDALAIRVFAPWVALNDPRRRVQGAFTYLGDEYRVWVTDPVIEQAFLAQKDGRYSIGECYLTMSLGEPSDDGYCYKLIAAVITRVRAAEGA